MTMWTDTEIELMRADQESLMGDTVRVDRIGPDQWDEEHQQTVPEVTTLYEGKGRVVVAHGAPTVLTSGEWVTPRSVTITVPHTVSPARGDRVTVSPRGNLPLTTWVESVAVEPVPATCTRMVCGELS